MGGGSSKPKKKPAPPAPPPPVVVEKPYPGGDPLNPSKPPPNAITNLSISRASECNVCHLLIDTKVSTSGVTLTRDIGNISVETADRFKKDSDNVKNGRLSVGDFIANLQNGKYFWGTGMADTVDDIVPGTVSGSYFAKMKISDSDAAKVTTKDDVEKLTNTWFAPPGKDTDPTLIKGTVSKVTLRGGFSSETKAKFKLSIPIKIKYVSYIKNYPKWEQYWDGFPLRPIWREVARETPVEKELTISMFTLYHPSPLRIENVQHDAVLSLNDPSDKDSVSNNESAVILIPLKASNNVDESVDFFSKVARYLPTITAPGPGGTYANTNIPTGKDWSVKKVFHLEKTEEGQQEPQFSKVIDGYYTWTGTQEYSYTENRIGNTIIRGWKPSGTAVKYFMIDEPISISTSDLSYLTRSLPPTPPSEAINIIPEKTEIKYKAATGSAVCADKESFTTLREGMENQSTGAMLGSLFTGGTADDLLVDSKGIPIADKDTCDPFKNNLKSAMKQPSFFTPAKFFAMFFNVLVLVAIAFGTWLAMYLIANKDFDGKYLELSETAGKVVGKLALQANGKIREASQRFASLKSLASGEVPEAANLAASVDEKLPDLKALAPGGKIPGIPSGLGSLASGFLKKV